MNYWHVQWAVIAAAAAAVAFPALDYSPLLMVVAGQGALLEMSAPLPPGAHVVMRGIDCAAAAAAAASLPQLVAVGWLCWSLLELRLQMHCR